MTIDCGLRGVGRNLEEKKIARRVAQHWKKLPRRSGICVLGGFQDFAM